jgi:hypothetical protein
MTPETRAALALADAGVPVGAIDRVLGLLDVDTHDNEATITAKVDELRSDLPGVFDAQPVRRSPVRPAVHPDQAGVASGGQAFAERGRAALKAAGIKAKDDETSAVARGRQRFADGGDLPPAA